MGILRILLPFINVGLGRDILSAVAVGDEFPNFGEGFRADSRGIGTHIGDKTHRAFGSQFDAFIEALRDHHRALDAETQFAGGLLLQGGSDKRRHRVAFLLASGHRLHDIVRVGQLIDDFGGSFFAGYFDCFVVLFSEVRFENGRLLSVQADVDGPILALLEGADFAFPFHDKPECDGLNPAGGESAADFVPEQRRDFVADQAVENAASLLCFHQMDVDGHRGFERFLDGVRGDFIEHHAIHRRAVLLPLQFLLQVIADRLAFAVRIGCEVDGVDALRSGLEFGDELLFPFDNLIVRREVGIDRHREILLGQILNMTERSFDDVVLPEIFTDRFRLRRRLDDDERVCHLSP